MPSNKKTRRAILNAIPTMTNGKIAELGAGFGLLAIPLAKRFPSCEILAYELSPFPYFVMKLAKIFFNLKNLTVIRENFLQARLSRVDVCFCFLCPKTMAILSKKMKVELLPGALVISNTFSLPGWKEEKVLKVNDFYRSQVWVYRKPF